jgi:hypothetical protein
MSKNKQLHVEIKQEVARVVEKALSDRENNKPVLNKWVVVPSVITALVAVAALVLSIYNYYQDSNFNNLTLNQTEKHNFKSVEPILSPILNINPNDPVWDFLGIAVENKGIGPAKIFPALLLFDGEQVGFLEPSSFSKIERKLKPPKGVQVTVHRIHGYLSILPGDRIMVFWSKDKESKDVQNYFAYIMKHITIIYPYTSLYEEKYEMVCISGANSPDFRISPPDEWIPFFGNAPMLITSDTTLLYPENKSLKNKPQ